MFGGLFVYAKLIQAGMLSWRVAAVRFVLGALIMLPLVRVARGFGLIFG